MLSVYSTPSSQLARYALNLSLRYIHSTPFRTGHNPLNVTVPTDELGLPITPLPLPIPSLPHTTITRETLVKLHRLSALNPPEEGSAEEKELLEGLGELVGLMDVVKNVQLPEGDIRTITSELLGQGVGEVVFDQHSLDSSSAAEEKSSTNEQGKNGRELLELATRRVGDYYAAKVKQ